MTKVTPRVCPDCGVDLTGTRANRRRCVPCAEAQAKKRDGQRGEAYRKRKRQATLGSRAQALGTLPGEKYCGRCSTNKPLAQFRPNKRSSDGKHCWCSNCLTVYARERTRMKRGLPLDAPLMQGRRPPRPEGYTFTHRGYVIEKRLGHHRADEYGWVFQHVLVAEDKYGFPITREYTVHHRNADRGDNRPENLELRVGNHGKGGDVMDTLLRQDHLRARALDILAQYGYAIQAPLLRVAHGKPPRGKVIGPG